MVFKRSSLSSPQNASGGKAVGGGRPQGSKVGGGTGAPQPCHLGTLAPMDSVYSIYRQCITKSRVSSSFYIVG